MSEKKENEKREKNCRRLRGFLTLRRIKKVRGERQESKIKQDTSDEFRVVLFLFIFLGGKRQTAKLINRQAEKTELKRG